MTEERKVSTGVVVHFQTTSWANPGFDIPTPTQNGEYYYPGTMQKAMQALEGAGFVMGSDPLLLARHAQGQ